MFSSNAYILEVTRDYSDCRRADARWPMLFPMWMVTLSAFGPLDWSVLTGYLVMVVGMGLWFSRRKKTDAEDYFLAGRRLPAWAAAMSVMATSLSAATFIGGPEEAFKGNLTYLASYLGLILAAGIVAIVFIPAFYRHNVTTVYELLERRYGPAAKQTGSAMFMIGRVFASGARLYIGGIAGAAIAFGQTEPWQIAAAVGVLVLIGAAYTYVGGIEAVVWTDVVQCFVFVGAGLAAIFLLLQAIPVGLPQIIEALREPAPGAPSKLTWIDTAGGFTGKDVYALPSILIGFTLLGIGSYGTDQDMTQRMLTCRTAKQGAWSAFGGVAVSLPVALIFMCVGLLLWVFYTRPDLMGAAMPEAGAHAGREVFLSYILDHVPPGVSGLMMAGLFAAALSSLNSELNAMSSTLITDFYRPMRPGRPGAHYVRAGRLGVAAWAMALGIFAICCAFWQDGMEGTLIRFALGVMTFAYSGLIAVFLAALLTKRGSVASVIAALVTGFVVILTLRLQTRVDIAFTWQLTLGVTIAFAVCCVGKPYNQPQ